MRWIAMSVVSIAVTTSLTTLALPAVQASSAGGRAAPTSRMAPAARSATLPRLAVPPSGCRYHGVYPGGRSGNEDDIRLSDVTSYETTAGAPAAWVYFSNNWYRSRAFPMSQARWIDQHGAVPFIRLMLRHNTNELKPSYGPDRSFPLRAIVHGRFDASLHRWGVAARRFGRPLLVEYGTEANGFWFSWNATHNGRATGAALFRAAFRHIVTVIRDAGASNISWVFHVNNDDQPARPWNRMERYYPGDRYVDWLAVSDYGAVQPNEHWNRSFRAGLVAAYRRLTALAPGKPIAVAEFGVTKGNPRVDPVAWASRAFDALASGNFPAIRGFAWWNERWSNDGVPAHDSDLRIQDIAGMGAVFSAALQQPGVVTSPQAAGSADWSSC
jgi:hypothetical protein